MTVYVDLPFLIDLIFFPFFLKFLDHFHVIMVILLFVRLSSCSLNDSQVALGQRVISTRTLQQGCTEKRFDFILEGEGFFDVIYTRISTQHAKFADASRLFGLTIGLGKTEVQFQPATGSTVVAVSSQTRIWEG